MIIRAMVISLHEKNSSVFYVFKKNIIREDCSISSVQKHVQFQSLESS